MVIVFWILLSLVVYCYFGYPLILRLVLGVFKKDVQKKSITPSVSVVIAVFNEDEVIERKIKNILSLDYPQDKLELIIGSDGSTDKTCDIVQKHVGSQVKFFEYKERRGKMATLNDLVEQVNSEVIVFADARQTFAPDALKQLVDNFTDSKIGCVSGELVFREKDGATAKGVGMYWKYEKYIRSLESQIHSMLGATGAIYAIRRALFRPIPAQVVLDDMYVPLNIIAQGYRAIYDDSAKAYDDVADSPKEEHQRKARTLYGNYQIFGIMHKAFNPFISPIAVQLFSHKLLRVIIPFFLLAIYVINLALIGHGFYNIIFILQNIFYGMAIIGGLARHQKYGILQVISKICYVPYVFCLLNFSAFVGFIRFVRSGQTATWQKARS